MSFAVRSIQAIHKCFTEYGVWHQTHHGGCSCLSRCEWVMSVCPIHRRDRIISSLWDFLYPSFHSPISVFIVWSLLCGMLFHLNCHLFWVKFFISIFKSVYGISKLLSIDISQAVLAAESAWLFPLILMWPGIHHSSISLGFDSDFNLFNICGIRGLSRFCFFRDVRTDKEKNWWMWWSLSYNVEYQIYGFSFCTVDRSAVKKSVWLVLWHINFLWVISCQILCVYIYIYIYIYIYDKL